MLYVILPAFNEEHSLPILLNRFERVLGRIKLAYIVVLVDDGSTDKTAEIALDFKRNMNLDLVSHPYNMGLGAAMRTGFDYVAKQCRHDDLILTMDADDTHSPEILGDMIAMINDGKDVVIASRYAQGGKEIGLSSHRKILSRGASFLLRLFFPIEGAEDYTCGFRLYRAKLIKKAVNGFSQGFITTNSFVCMAEILIKVSYLKARVGEVPLVLRYDLKHGQSKMKKIQTILRYLRLIAHEKFLPTTTAT